MNQQTQLGATVVIAIIVAAVVALGVGSLTSGGSSSPSLPPTDRVVYMTAVEFKGATTVDKLDAPDIDMSKLESAYGFKWVEEGKKWQVAAYLWDPSQITVNQGDRLKMVFFAVNGDKHTITIDNYIEDDFVLNRGRWVTKEFVANTPGTFLIGCDEHKPHMTGTLVVLPA